MVDLSLVIYLCPRNEGAGKWRKSCGTTLNMQTSSVSEIEFINSFRHKNNVLSVDFMILQGMGIRKTEHKDIFVKDVVNVLQRC